MTETYKIPEIIKIIESNPYTNQIYKNKVGVIGSTILKTPFLSDNSKLEMAKHANPENKKNIEKIQTCLDVYKKGKNIHKNYLSSQNKDALNQYELYLTNRGGRKRRKSKKNKTAKKKRNKSRKIKCNPNKLCNLKFIYS